MFALFDYMSLAQSGGDTCELELIGRQPKKAVSDTPVVFVHGAYAGAWCWDEHFLAYFAQRGYNAYALSLRGHGQSDGHDRLHSFGIADYVRDLERVVEEIGGRPLVVGHSMGGMVVQKFLERQRPAGAVLMASVPPSGLSGSVARLMTSDPMLLFRMTLIHAGNPTPEDLEIARRAVFSDHLPEEQLIKYARHFKNESQRALWDMMMANLPQHWRVRRVPMLVLGAEEDTLFSPAMVRNTARTYGTEAEIFPGMAHGMMLEHDWQLVADRIIDWMVEQAL
jgi:pimeloyl-ACP methyl ester carboxylesterase